MRAAGGVLIVLGLLLCLTIFGAIFGIPMILIGIVMIAVGGRKTVITNTVTVSNVPHQPFQDTVSQIGSDQSPLLTNRREGASVIDAISVEVPQSTPSQKFVNALDELTLRASAILERARNDGFNVDIQKLVVTVMREGRAPITLQSNTEVLEFGRFAGY